MKLALVTISLLLLTASCSNKLENKQRPIVQYASLSAHPIKLETQVTTCTPHRLIHHIPKFLLNLFIKGEYKQSRYDLKTSVAGREVRSKYRDIISSTLYDHETITYYKASYSDTAQEWLPGNIIKEEEVSSAKQVKICPTVNHYHNNSVEGAALSVNYTVNKTYLAVHSLFPKLKIAPISIKVAPLYGTKITAANQQEQVTFTHYLTDNAFYQASDSSIQFLPQSEEAVLMNVFGSKSLWNVPMVGSHEYGHHLFAMIYPEAVSKDQHSVHKKGLCFDNRIHKVGKFSSKTISNLVRSADQQEVLAALNEGFADLVAYYSLGDQERSLDGITCLETNRDVGSKYFANLTTEKKFSNEVLESFFSLLTNTQHTSCLSTPDFQDIHTIGAIFASSTDRLLNIVTQDKKRKLKVTVQWLHDLRNFLTTRTIHSPKKVLRVSFILLVKTISKEFKLNENHYNYQKLCLKSQEVYPNITQGHNPINVCKSFW